MSRTAELKLFALQIQKMLRVMVAITPENIYATMELVV
jgi:hypothetical protein